MFSVKIFREKQKANTSVQAKRTRRATQTQKTKLKSTGSFISVEDEYSLNSFGPNKTPQKFGKQIRQCTYECNRNFPKLKAMQCAIIYHQICQRLNSPTTQNTMLQIIHRYSSQILTKRDSNDSQKSATQYENKVSNLVKSVVKIQKYKWTKNMPKFHEYVKQLKEKYSICDAARTLKMHYSQLHSLLSCKKTTWPSSCSMCKEKCDKLLLRQKNITATSLQEV